MLKYEKVKKAMVKKFKNIDNDRMVRILETRVAFIDSYPNNKTKLGCFFEIKAICELLMERIAIKNEIKEVENESK